MAKILGLDISSQRTGVAVLNKGRLLRSSFELIEPNPKKSYGERLSYFRTELRRILAKHQPEHIVIEDIFKGRNLKTFKILAMFRGVAIQTIYEETNQNPVSLMPTDARSTLDIGVGKEDAFCALVEKYKLDDFNFDDHNDIVDAIGLASALQVLIKQGHDAKSLQSLGRGKKRKRRRNKKGVSKARS